MRFQKQENEIGSLNLSVLTISSHLISQRLTCESMPEENKRREAGDIDLVFTACQTEHWPLSPQLKVFLLWPVMALQHHITTLQSA